MKLFQGNLSWKNVIMQHCSIRSVYVIWCDLRDKEIRDFELKKYYDKKKITFFLPNTIAKKKYTAKNFRYFFKMPEIPEIFLIFLKILKKSLNKTMAPTIFERGLPICGSLENP
jgi:hypothetical protein